MEVILGKRAGFCPGVTNTIIKAQKHLQNNTQVYCLGDLVHNKYVISSLEEKGLKTVDDIQEVPDGVDLIIRSHGIPKQTYDVIRLKNINLIDLTCPKVLAIHKQAEDYEKNGYYIILIGEKIHPEIIGTYSFCGKNSTIVEQEQDINLAVQDIIKKDIRNITVLAQTTFSMEKFDTYVENIKSKIPKNSNLEINKTICDATRLRQQETLEMAKQVELMIIIGGKNSSNTKKLYEIATQTCGNAMFVESVKDVYTNYISRFKKIGVMAGASTPKELIDQVVELIKNTETENWIYENSR